MGALAAADLVVEDGRATEPRELGDRLDVVVRGARAAVADDHRVRPASRGRRRPSTTSRARPSSSVPRPSQAPPFCAAGGGTPRGGRCRAFQRGPLDAADLGRVGAARVEAATGRRVDRARHLALEHDPLAVPARVRSSVSIAGIADSSASVYGWIGCVEELVDGADSTITPRYITAIRSETWWTIAEVVRDEDVREVEVVLEVVEQVDHLRLDRDVERGDRLVGDDQLRVQRERARDADPLALPAGELVRDSG